MPKAFPIPTLRATLGVVRPTENRSMRTGKTCLAACLIATVWLISGCGSAPKTSAGAEPERSGSLSDKFLTAIGIKKDDSGEKPESSLPDRRVRWRLFASDALNLNAAGQPVALLTRLYKLKNVDAFLKAPYEIFGDPVKEKEALGEDLISSRDLQLIPGQRYEQVEKVGRDAGFLGIVALYRAPAPQHWRRAFKSDSAEVHGIHLGLHACAISVHTNDPVGQNIRHQQSVAIPCPKPVATEATREIQP